MSTPLPVHAGHLTVAVTVALLGDEAVLQLVLNAERMQGRGLVLRAGVLQEEGVGQGGLCRQPVHGMEGQDTFQEVHRWGEGSEEDGMK